MRNFLRISKKSATFAQNFVTTFFVTMFFVVANNMENPFKFGSIVENEFFTDRVQETEYICNYLKSRNHLVLISPRRFGKSSVVLKAVKQTERKYIQLNLQKVTSMADFAAKLLAEVYRTHPWEKIKDQVMRFRVIPNVTSNQVTGALTVAFQPTQDQRVLLEDVFALMENAHTEDNRLVVILDEFQEIRDISPVLEKTLRAIMQEQKHINYILLGSQESMMTDIFENVQSPFYHFGGLMRLKKLPREEFEQYLLARFEPVFHEQAAELKNQVLDYTKCHPYYTQELAFYMWQVGAWEQKKTDVMAIAIKEIIDAYDLSYERIWANFNRTDMWILQRLAAHAELQTGEYRTSTIYSALKRLQHAGHVIYTDRYEIEDPFFGEWMMAKH